MLARACVAGGVQLVVDQLPLQASRRSSRPGRCPSTGRPRSCCTRSRAAPAAAGSGRWRTGSPGPSGPPAPPPGGGGATAISRASTTSRLFIVSSIDQPTIIRLNRSSTTARYSHPSPVGMYVMSAHHDAFGPAGSKSRSRTFSATGRRWSRVGRADEPPRGLRPDAVVPHELGHRVLRAGVPAGVQLGGHPRAAVPALHLGVDLLDRRRPAPAAAARPGWRAGRPRRSTRTGRHLQGVAHPGDRPLAARGRR